MGPLREKLRQLWQKSLTCKHAYSSTKGTDTALSTLVNMIEKFASSGAKICLVLSVDIMGAFNNLATKTIHNVLVDNNYPPIMIRWYMNFLKNRNSIAEVLGIIKTIRPVCGDPTRWGFKQQNLEPCL